MHDNTILAWSILCKQKNFLHVLCHVPSRTYNMSHNVYYISSILIFNSILEIIAFLIYFSICHPSNLFFYIIHYIFGIFNYFLASTSMPQLKTGALNPTEVACFWPENWDWSYCVLVRGRMTQSSITIFEYYNLVLIFNFTKLQFNFFYNLNIIPLYNQ